MTPEEIKAKAAVVRELQDFNRTMKRLVDMVGWCALWLAILALTTCVSNT